MSVVGSSCDRSYHTRPLDVAKIKAGDGTECRINFILTTFSSSLNNNQPAYG